MKIHPGDFFELFRRRYQIMIYSCIRIFLVYWIEIRSEQIYWKNQINFYKCFRNRDVLL